MGNLKVRISHLHRMTLPVAIILLVLAVLFLGLRSKSQPGGNTVTWLSDQKALQFNKTSIAYVENIRLFGYTQETGHFTMQMAVAPAGVEKQGFRPILLLHDGIDHNQLAVWSWGKSLIVMNGDDYDYSKRWSRISAKNTFSPGETTFITISSGESGTALYINGKLARKRKDLRLTLPDSGMGPRLILGNSGYGRHGWSGEISVLALYNVVFSPELVGTHYLEWQQKGKLPSSPIENTIFLYAFDEHLNASTADSSGRNQPMQLPKKLKVFHKKLLAPPWQNAAWNRSFVSDAILNLFGFMPLGAAMCLWLRQAPEFLQRRMTLIIVVTSFVLSLFIETVQAWLPGRSSSQLDLYLNTIGGLGGILFVNVLRRQGKK